MKKNTLLSLLLICGFLSSISFAEQDGVFLSEYVDDPVILDSSKGLSVKQVSELIEDYISDVNPGRDQEDPEDISTKDLADRIAGVAYCFEVDPFVLTSLIHKESINYDQRAKSPTGAIGFTQFTTVAMKEVNDQLGLRGPKYAQAEATTYFNSVLMSDCLEKNGGFKHTGASYVPLWEKAPASTFTNGTRTQAFQMVKMLASKPEYALIYGAILMKVNYSLVQSGRRTGCYSYAPRHQLTMKEKLKEVMMMYNGDGCTTQKKYQSDILDRYYPDITGVPAK